MKTLGIILLVVAAINYLICMISTFMDDTDLVCLGVTLVFGCVTAILGGIIVSKANIPTDKDVLNGKAEYQETVHITGTDTIKTYQIVWKSAGNGQCPQCIHSR